MKMNKKGFTLVEIMIVVAIIGILAAIAIPNFVRYRKTAQANACIGNLKQIQSATEQLLMAGGDKDSVDLDDICGADNYIKARPVCPTTKTSDCYTCGNADRNVPTCGNSTDDYPHKLADDVADGQDANANQQQPTT